MSTYVFLFLLEKKLFLDPVISNKKVSFSGSKIYVQAHAFDSLTESLSSGVGRFCHVIKLIKYHVTKRLLFHFL